MSEPVAFHAKRCLRSSARCNIPRTGVAQVRGALFNITEVPVHIQRTRHLCTGGVKTNSKYSHIYEEEGELQVGRKRHCQAQCSFSLAVACVLLAQHMRIDTMLTPSDTPWGATFALVQEATRLRGHTCLIGEAAPVPSMRADAIGV
jgi:hypothetical protein